MAGARAEAWKPEGVPARRRILNLLLTALLAILCAGAGYTCLLVAQTQDERSEASRYNITWLISQAGVELARFQAAVGGAAMPDGTSLDEVQLRLDILMSRLQTLESGDVRSFIDSDGEFEGIVARLRDALDQAQTLVDKFDTRDAAAQLFGLLAPLQSKFARLASAANIRSGDQVAKFQSQLTFLYHLLVSVMAGSVLCGAGLILSQRQYGALQRAHEAVQKLAAELRQSGDRFNAALSNMGQGLCLFDGNGRLVVHNQSFTRMFGEPGPDASASTLGQAHGVTAIFAPPVMYGGEASDRRSFELADGRVIQVSRQAVPGEGWVSTYEDVTDRRRSEERLSYMARHDALTGLPNRVCFREHMEQSALALREGAYLAVFCLDLDGFKAVNDTFGHPSGDELLRLVARRLRGCMREHDLVARLGGDEFAVIQLAAEGIADTLAMADRLVQVVRAPFELQGHRVEISTSIGVVVADAADATPDELLRNADIALYRAKAEGRAAWRLFHPDMDIEIQRRRALQTDMRLAFEQDQFDVHYQPLVCARGYGVTGFEALLRWRHPTRGMISPGEFIPLAEEVGLIEPLGFWVLKRACVEAARWPGHIKIAVNLSPVQFGGGQLVRHVQQALADSGLPASRLELEVTESVLLQENETTLSSLHGLRDLGVRISMDDFGTGFSSLSYLRRFPFNKIKVDQSFVRSLERDHGAIEIVRAVVSLGKALGMAVLAEGVETVEQLRILQAEGCDELQGYLFSSPQPLAQAEALIAANSGARTWAVALRSCKPSSAPVLAA